MLDKATKETISGEDLAFGIQFTVTFPENRQLTFTTAFPQDCNDGDLKRLLKRMSGCADYLDSIYRARALRKLIEQEEFGLETVRQQVRNTEVKYRNEWEASNRKGSMRLSAGQKAALSNFETTERRYVDSIKKLRSDLADLEKLQQE